MKIITIATLKGGSGKTMNTFNIAGILAEKHKVLLIDVDPQCNLTSNCGVDLGIDDSQTVRSIFNRRSSQPDIDQLITKSPIPELSNLDLIASSILLFRTEKELSTRSNKEKIMESYFRKYIDRLLEYDYIFIDTNPSMSVINMNAFMIADKIILSSDISMNSIKGAELFCALWKDEREDLEKDDNVEALIICNYNGRLKISKEVNRYAYNDADIPKGIILNTIIPASVKLKNTEAQSKPINILYPHDKITTLYRELVDELKEREVL